MNGYDFEQFAAVRNYADLSFSPDGEWVTYVCNASGQFNVWKQSVVAATEGQPAMPNQLTALVEHAAWRAIWSPVGHRILTMADRHGNENFQLYLIPAEHGWLYPLTEKPEVRHQLGQEPLSPDGRLVAFSTNERSREDVDLNLLDLESGEIRPLLAGNGIYYGMSWSPDGQTVLAMRFNHSLDQDLFLVDTAREGESRHLTPHKGDVKFHPVAWRPDGRGFYLLCDRGRQFLGLAFYELEDGKIHWLETPEWDVDEADLSGDGRFLAWVVNEDGYSQLYVRDLESGAVRDYPDLPQGVLSDLTFSPATPLLGFYLNRSVRPAELTLLDVTDGGWRKLSQAFLGGIPEAEMVEPEIIRFPTYDGREIPAFLYEPRGYDSGALAPVVLSIHGGPQAQERPGYNYNGLYQYLLNRGIGIMAANIRGSSGYGKSYEKLIYRDWGGGELRDLEHAAQYLRKLEWVDEARIGVFGASFGGFATLSCLTRLPEYWAAAVDIVGPSNLVTFARAVPPHWKRFMKKWVGDPDEDAEMLMERSPITYVQNVRAPLLVIQGANDSRVVKGESDQMVERLQELGREVEYMVLEDEGHEPTKTSTWLKSLRASAEWFQRHL